MTVLKIEKTKIQSVDFGNESSLPSISEKLRLAEKQDVFELDEEDGLFINYGMVDYAYPYRAQDNYVRELQEKEQVSVVLENDYLKAFFYPQFGGKLYSLYDKVEGKELLFVNSVIRPCHLGVRNAWMSGGVEWNCGYVGHTAFTCDWMHTAKTHLEDGTPVLRFYQYERIRGVVYQMDFFLPEESRLLFARMKIVNPQFQVVPMYWWSNIATPDQPGNRVIVPANNAFTTKDEHPVKIAVPIYNGIDVTYPLDNVISIDYFWNIQPTERKFICQVDQEGYGLVQTSTQRLKGRKLFVWGNSAGGDCWKNFLTADGESGSYNEIQAGLAQTQYECLPMPPKTVWEWMEAYGALHTDPNKTHSDWETAKAEVAASLHQMISEEALEELLYSTKKMSKSAAEEVLFYADGWGALEQEKRRILGQDPMCKYLDFGALTDEQLPWISLLKTGSLGEHDPFAVPVSYIYGPEWLALLKQATERKDQDNWFTWLQLGLHTLIDKDYELAGRMLQKSVQSSPSPWAFYGLAVLNRDKGCHHKEVEYMLEAWKLLGQDASLAKALLRCLYENKQFALLKDIYESMEDGLQVIPRCMVYYAFALLEEGNVESAEAILYGNGGLLVPDIRECETITLDLWIAIEKAKKEAIGEPFDESTIQPPQFVDFRMFANVDWLNGGTTL